MCFMRNLVAIGKRWLKDNLILVKKDTVSDVAGYSSFYITVKEFYY